MHVPQRPQRVRDPRPVGVRVLLGPVPALGVLAAEPAGEGGQVGQHREHAQRPGGAGQPAAQRGAGRAGHAALPPGRAVPEQREDGEERQEVDAGPLHPGRAAEQHPGGDPPPPRAEGEPGRGTGVRPDPGPHPVAVDHQAGHRADHEGLQEDVEQPDPADGEREPVQRHQQARDQPEQGGTGEPAGQPGQHDHRDGPGDQAGEPPAGAVVAEDPDAQGDQQLAQRRVDDEGVAAVVLVAPLDHLVGLGRVVRLVEEQVAGVGQVPQPADEAWRRRAPRSAPRTARGRWAAAGSAAGPAGAGGDGPGAPSPRPPDRGPAPPRGVRVCRRSDRLVP